MNKFLITIVGPTAIGKTSLAIKLAKHYQTEVISADSRQFYKELNIGTAKPTSEELSSVKHHLINNISVTDDYDISQFQSDAKEKINNVFKMKDFAIMVGGSGLYIDSVLYGIDKIPKIDISIRENLNEEFNINGLKNLIKKLKKLDPITYKKIDLNNHRRIIRALEVSISSNKPYSSFLNRSEKQSKYNEIIELVNTSYRDYVIEKDTYQNLLSMTNFYIGAAYINSGNIPKGAFYMTLASRNASSKAQSDYLNSFVDKISSYL